MNSEQTTRSIVRKYWMSWQILNREDMETTVSENYVLFLYGQRSPAGKQELLFNSFDRGIPWNDVEMLSETYAANSASIYYTGIDTSTQNRIFVSEFLQLDDNGQIVTNHSMIFPPPAPEEVPKPYYYIELWRAKPRWWNLSHDDRRALIAQIEPHGIEGTTLFALAINEAGTWRVPYDYFSVWEVETEEQIHRVEKRVDDLDWWYEYWEEVHAWGKKVQAADGNLVQNHMIATNQSTFFQRAESDGVLTSILNLTGAMAVLGARSFPCPIASNLIQPFLESNSRNGGR